MKIGHHRRVATTVFSIMAVGLAAILLVMACQGESAAPGDEATLSPAATRTPVSTMALTTPIPAAEGNVEAGRCHQHANG